MDVDAEGEVPLFATVPPNADKTVAAEGLFVDVVLAVVVLTG